MLLATLFILIRSPIPPTTIFTIEAPPQRFSQPMNVSLPDEIYSQQQQHQDTRPYYLGHHNKIHPVHDRDLSTMHVTADIQKEMSNQSIYDTLRSGRQTILMLQDQQQDNNSRHSYYHPQYNPTLSSMTSFNYTTTEGSSSTHSSRLPLVESQRTLKSLATTEESTSAAPMQFDLPIIKLGHISNMDTDFLEKMQKKE